MNQPTWIGQTLSGRYRIDQMLGQGGMSAVYRAYDPNLKRDVAIKLVHSHLSNDPEFVKRFEEEAAVVASLRHANIVQVFDFNSDNGVSYMVMEFIPGETLQERLKRLNASRQRMSVEDAIRFTVDTCNALSYAHKRGMVHRDIKPANIMLDVNNQAILMDFGIVKILGGSSHTVTGAVMGTARYMPPELVRSEPADQRTDIYALGVTLYEMLSGRTPFDADSAMTVMMMHLNDPVPDLRQLRADIDPRLIQVVMRSLAKDRNFRYQTTEEFAAALLNYRNQPLSQGQSASGVYPAGVSAGQRVPSQPVAPGSYPPPPSGQFNPPSRPNPVPSTSGSYQSGYVQPPGSGPHPAYSAGSVSGPYPVVEPPKKKSKLWLWLGGLGATAVIGVIVVAVVGNYLFSNLNGGSTNRSNNNQNGSAMVMTPSKDVSAISVTDTPMLYPTADQPVIAAVPLETLDVIDVSSTVTPTSESFSVRITEIGLSPSNQYLVYYETVGFKEQLPGMHIHFFFNTVLPENAGMPGSGPWVLYGGPSPFTGYTTYQTPRDARQMCALVANGDHTVIQGSGNCVDLPRN